MLCLLIYVLFFFFFKQKTAYEMRISDWSSDVCSSDLCGEVRGGDGRRRRLCSLWRAKWPIHTFSSGDRLCEAADDENLLARRRPTATGGKHQHDCYGRRTWGVPAHHRRIAEERLAGEECV